MIIGFTGTRAGMEESQRSMVREILEAYEDVELHHGDCVGADSEIHTVAMYRHIPRIVVHPPTYRKYRAFRGTGMGTHESATRGVEFKNTTVTVLKPDGYRERNQAIVDACDILVAAPNCREEENQRSGTWMTVRMARKQGKTVLVVMPEGELTEESR